MKPSRLSLSVLNYGARSIPVHPTAHLPLPAVFDFDDPRACARLIASIMSNAAGGFLIRDVRARIHPRRRTVSITGGGMHVFYRPDDLDPIDPALAAVFIAECEVLSLGDVRSDQYAGSWKAAVWVSNERKLETV